MTLDEIKIELKDMAPRLSDMELLELAALATLLGQSRNESRRLRPALEDVCTE